MMRFTLLFSLLFTAYIHTLLYERPTDTFKVIKFLYGVYGSSSVLNEMSQSKESELDC